MAACSLNHAQAVKYALFENGHHPETIVELARDIELDMATCPRPQREIPMTSVSNPAIWLAGYIPDIPTPLDEHGAVDLAAFARLCERQIDAGVTAIVVGETGGEASTLTPAEQEDIIRAAVKVARGRVRVVAGADPIRPVWRSSWRSAPKVAGADALLSVVPYYNKPMQAGIQAHSGRLQSRPRCRSSCTTFHPGPCASCPMTRYCGSPVRDTSSG